MTAVTFIPRPTVYLRRLRPSGAAPDFQRRWAVPAPVAPRLSAAVAAAAAAVKAGGAAGDVVVVRTLFGSRVLVPRDVDLLRGLAQQA